MNTKCKRYQNNLLELAFDADNAAADLKTHVAQCADCSDALASFQATLQMMDTWIAPEPSPYFNVRMAARLREERAAEPAGWFEQLRARIQFLSNFQLRPILAGALATAIMIGGGAFAGLSPAPVAPSAAVVNDLRLMDHNDKALEQMDLLEADNDTSASNGSNLNP